MHKFPLLIPSPCPETQYSMPSAATSCFMSAVITLCTAAENATQDTGDTITRSRRYHRKRIQASPSLGSASLRFICLQSDSQRTMNEGNN
jgi:hypothetical protein